MRAAGHEPLNGVLTHLRQAIDVQGAGAPTDGELLRRYVATRDQAAFELLVWRHGTMVLHACRRLLSRAEDAEDAFQATFLALVRRAGAISKREAVAGWLYTVGCRIALRARGAAARRAAGEQAAGRTSAAARLAHHDVDPALWAEVRTVLDAEVNRLSAKLRDPFVLCYLEGLTNDEAARQLGVPKGTVLSRLARARERLRDRLARRGLTLSGAGLAAHLCHEATALAAPAPLVAAAVKAATLIAAGQTTAGAVSAPALALMEGALQAMFLSKLKTMTAVVLTLGLVAAGAGGLMVEPRAAGQAAAPQQAPQAAPARKPAAADASDPQRLRAEEAERQAQLARAQEDLRVLQARMQQVTAKLEQVRILHDQARSDFETVKAQLALANQQLAAVQGQPGAAPPKKNSPQEPNLPARPALPALPASPKPPPALPASAFPDLNLPQGASADFIQLGTAYIDAVRDFEAASVRAQGASNEIDRINLRAAQRKLGLLRAIIDGSLKGAESDLARLRQLRDRHLISESEVNQRETRAQVLKLILDSAR